MPLIAKRVLGALLALIGLALTVLGAWFVSHLGTTGTATFTTTVDRSQPVVLDPSVLNRVDVPVTVTATAPGQKDVWIGLASPSDARMAIDGGTHTAVTGVHVPDWTLSTSVEGSKKAPDVTKLDLWGDEATGKGSVTLVVPQDGTAETVVVAAPDNAEVATVEATWPKRTWFYQALVVVVAGLLMLLVGLLTAFNVNPVPSTSRPGRPGRHGTRQPS